MMASRSTNPSNDCPHCDRDCRHGKVFSRGTTISSPCMDFRISCVSQLVTSGFIAEVMKWLVASEVVVQRIKRGAGIVHDIGFWPHFPLMNICWSTSFKWSPGKPMTRFT